MIGGLGGFGWSTNRFEGNNIVKSDETAAHETVKYNKDKYGTSSFW